MYTYARLERILWQGHRRAAGAHLLHRMGQHPAHFIPRPNRLHSLRVIPQVSHLHNPVLVLL
jgi:hypothetical protein